jgi:hypothetical protein
MAQALPDELERVIILRETYRHEAARARVLQSARADWARSDFGPAITMMTAAIDSAKAALASGDVLHVLQAHAQLQGFTE